MSAAAIQSTWLLLRITERNSNLWRFLKFLKIIDIKHVLNGIDRTKKLYESWEEAKKKAKFEFENGNYEKAHEYTVEMGRHQEEIQKAYEECVRTHSSNLDACKEIRKSLNDIRKAGLKVE